MFKTTVDELVDQPEPINKHEQYLIMKKALPENLTQTEYEQEIQKICQILDY